MGEGGHKAEPGERAAGNRKVLWVLSEPTGSTALNTQHSCSPNSSLGLKSYFCINLQDPLGKNPHIHGNPAPRTSAGFPRLKTVPLGPVCRLQHRTWLSSSKEAFLTSLLQPSILRKRVQVRHGLVADLGGILPGS